GYLQRPKPGRLFKRLSPQKSFRIQLDHETLFHRSRDIVTSRKIAHTRGETCCIELQPLWNLAALDAFESATDAGLIAALFVNGDLIALDHEVRRNVHFLAIDRQMSVTNNLASFRAGVRETGTVSDVVEAALESGEHVIARDALHALGLFKDVPELAFEQSVHLLDLLLLTKLQAIFRELDASLAVLSRRIAAAFERAFVGVAAV